MESGVQCESIELSLFYTNFTLICLDAPIWREGIEYHTFGGYSSKYRMTTAKAASHEEKAKSPFRKNASFFEIFPCFRKQKE